MGPNRLEAAQAAKLAARRLAKLRPKLGVVVEDGQSSAPLSSPQRPPKAAPPFWLAAQLFFFLALNWSAWPQGCVEWASGDVAMWGGCVGWGRSGPGCGGRCAGGRTVAGAGPRAEAGPRRKQLAVTAVKWEGHLLRLGDVVAAAMPALCRAPFPLVGKGDGTQNG